MAHYKHLNAGQGEHDAIDRASRVLTSAWIVSRGV